MSKKFLYACLSGKYFLILVIIELFYPEVFMKRLSAVLIMSFILLLNAEYVGFDKAVELLKAVRQTLQEGAERTPIPPGNIAYGKPARLLSLDGSHDRRSTVKLITPGRVWTAK